MTKTVNDDAFAFEQQVRRIARELWPDAYVSNSITLDGRERDGMFETEDCIHLLEVTVSRQKAKAEEDIKKLRSFAQKLIKQSKGKSVKCWFITRDEPTADQQAVAYPFRYEVNISEER